MFSRYDYLKHAGSVDLKVSGKIDHEHEHTHFDGDGYVNDVFFDADLLEKWINEVWPKRYREYETNHYSHIYGGCGFSEFDSYFYTDEDQEISGCLSRWQIMEGVAKYHLSYRPVEKNEKQYIPDSKDLWSFFGKYHGEKCNLSKEIIEKHEPTQIIQALKKEIIEKAKELFVGAKVDIRNQSKQKEFILSNTCEFIYSNPELLSVVKSKISEEDEEAYRKELNDSLVSLRERTIEELRKNWVSDQVPDFKEDKPESRRKDENVSTGAFFASMAAGVVAALILFAIFGAFSQ